MIWRMKRFTEEIRTFDTDKVGKNYDYHGYVKAFSGLIMFIYRSALIRVKMLSF